MSTHRHSLDFKWTSRTTLNPATAPNAGARKLRQILLRKTQREVGELVDIAGNTIGQYARGERLPEPDKRGRLEDRLAIPAIAWNQRLVRGDVRLESAANGDAGLDDGDAAESSRGEVSATMDENGPNWPDTINDGIALHGNGAANDLAANLLELLLEPIRASLHAQLGILDEAGRSRYVVDGTLAVRLVDDLLEPLTGALLNSAAPDEL